MTSKPDISHKGLFTGVSSNLFTRNEHDNMASYH